MSWGSCSHGCRQDSCGNREGSMGRGRQSEIVELSWAQPRNWVGGRTWVGPPPGVQWGGAGLKPTPGGGPMELAQGGDRQRKVRLPPVCSAAELVRGKVCSYLGNGPLQGANSIASRSCWWMRLLCNYWLPWPCAHLTSPPGWQTCAQEWSVPRRPDCLTCCYFSSDSRTLIPCLLVPPLPITSVSRIVPSINTICLSIHALSHPLGTAIPLHPTLTSVL